MSRSLRLPLSLAMMLLAAVPITAVGQDDPGAAESPAIPPGQEDLLLDMLGKGASLPGGCQIRDGRVRHTVVEVSYTCGLGDVVVELAHSSETLESEVQTRQFALSVLEGSAPTSLIDVLSSRILEREDGFEWVIAPEADGDEAP